MTFSNWRQSALTIALASAALIAADPGAMAQSASGCSTLAAEPITLPQGAVTAHTTGAVPLRGGETLQLRMVAPGDAAGTGSIAISESGETEAPIVSGAAPQQASFTAPYDGLYGLEFRALGPAQTTFEVTCGSTTTALAPSTRPQAFVERRAAHVLADDTSQASLRRRAAKPSSIDQAVKSTAVLDDKGEPTQVTVVTSVQNIAAAEGQSFAGNKLDVWVEGRVSQSKQRIDENGLSYDASGNAGSVYLGTDYLLRPGLMVGALVQVDQYNEGYDRLGASTASDGLLFGPYASFRIAPDLVFDARASWGGTENDASMPDGTRIAFDTDRQLLRGQLSGNRNLFGLQFTPTLALSVIEDRIQGQQALLAETDDGTAVLGRLGVGSAVSYRIALEDGGFVQPTATLSTGWNLDQLNSFTFQDAQFVNDTGAKAEAGVTLGTADGISIQATGAYEGLGEPDYSAWSGRLSLTAPLN